jgi:adenylate cyclase
VTIADFEKAGLYDPNAPNAAERLEILEWLAGRGVSIPTMQFALARGQLPFAASIRQVRPDPTVTLAQMAERLGVTTDLIECFRVAFGIPPVPEGDPWCTEEEAELFGAVTSGVVLFGEAGMLRLCRVLGASANRVAEAMVSANHERMRHTLSAAASELEIAKNYIAASETVAAPARIFDGLLGIHVQVAGIRSRERRTTVGAETLHACVGFVDLVGSTSLSRRLSATELAAVVDRFEEVAHAVAIDREGRIVKFIGDEVMFVTGNADAACDIALALVEAFAGDPSVTPRGGIAEGELIDRGGDYYGPVVNLAARLAELAVPREVLVASEVASHLSQERFRREPAGRRLLRGFDEAVSLVSVTRA